MALGFGRFDGIGRYHPSQCVCVKEDTGANPPCISREYPITKHERRGRDQSPISRAPRSCVPGRSIPPASRPSWMPNYSEHARDGRHRTSFAMSGDRSMSVDVGTAQCRRRTISVRPLPLERDRCDGLRDVDDGPRRRPPPANVAPMSCGMTALPLVNESSQADLIHLSRRSPALCTSFARRASSAGDAWPGTYRSRLTHRRPSGAAVQQILQRPRVHRNGHDAHHRRARATDAETRHSSTS
jgi:hypothetical protein